MSKIILTSINARYSHTNLALLYLETAMSLKTDDCICQTIEWDINRPAHELLEKLAESGGSCFVFSAYIWNSVYLKTLLPDLGRLLPDAVICTGGPEAVHNKPDWLKVSGLDFILDGNAEDFAAELCRLQKPAEASVIRKQPSCFSSTVFPYTEDSLRQFKGRIIYYEASRGCMFNCSYCLSSVDNSPVEYRTAEQIISEISLLSRFRGTVKFVDRTFNARPAVSRLIWRHMASNPPAGCFHFELHPSLLQDEDFRLIESLKASSAQFEIGIQSTNENVLRKVNRTDKPVESFKNIARIIEMKKFHVHLDQIIGLPGDCPAAAAESIDRILSLRPDVFQPGFLKIIPGTPLAAEALSLGIISSTAPPYEVLQTPSYSFLQLSRFKRIARLINLLYNSGFYQHSLPVIINKTGGWYRLFSKLLEPEPSLSRTGWEYWGQMLFEIAEATQPGASVIKDLLRFDWCFYAKAQRYPAYIDYENTDEIYRKKTVACRKIGSLHPEIRKSELKRSIIFIPESEEPVNPADRAYLFVRTAGKLQKFPIEKNIRHSYCDSSPQQL
ncbi:MAG: DUF4080 domain-containing protein [Spirochaetales bacterium]|uniref:DUF4080 domain-containing protein n=1 Tax=Candidatus Thalassospirochaeta sargassi TaxID=3119039 RepID=A0AAJ1MJF3_9SPIO|nr:DUF4080 domain-containing protein [Spirochaetales bacterium]